MEASYSPFTTAATDGAVLKEGRRQDARFPDESRPVCTSLPHPSFARPRDRLASRGIILVADPHAHTPTYAYADCH